jgi:probable F420-dependent oxidoreductase
MDLGKIGVWWSGAWRVTAEPELNGAAELESLGYGTLWSSGGFDPGFPPSFDRILSSTTRISVASGIISMWTAAPTDVGPAVAELEAKYPGRFLLGIGASHAAIVGDYTRPYSYMVSYLDALDELEVPVPKDRRVLAALRRRMLELAAERAAGAHPYFIPVEHTAFARSVLGPDSLLAPEVAVVVETDPAAARALARNYASIYLNLPNYTGNLKDFGFTDDDINNGGSDRLIDAVVPWGDAASIAGRISEHFDAGADHVCLQVISPTGRDGTLPINEYRELAGALIAG